MTRGQSLLLGLGLLGLGAAGYGVFQAIGVEGFSTGIAASVLLLLVLLGWTSTYLLRVVGGKMTFSEQRRRYRAAYDAATDAELQARFEALPADEQAKLLAQLGLGEQGAAGAPADPGGAPTP